LQTLQQNDNALVIDIRSKPERQATGIIPGNQNLKNGWQT